MKTIRVAYTSNQRIITIGRPTAMDRVLEADERIVHNWYYDQPRELESFLHQHPEKENDILKAFTYWVKKKVFGFEESQDHYGTLKRELQDFSEHLFKSLRAIAGRIAKQILQSLKPKKIKEIY